MIDALYNYRQGDIHSAEFSDEFNKLCIPFEDLLSDEQIDAVVNAILTVVRDGVMGKFSKETLAMFVNAINHDSDVASASEEGRVAGRNDKIVEGLRKRDKGDGTLPLNGKNGGAPGKQKSQSIFDIANEAM